MSKRGETGRAWVSLLMLVALIATACSTSSGLHVARSDQRSTATDPPTTEPTVPADPPASSDPADPADPADPVDPRDPGRLLWQACADQPSPWECSTLGVPMDYRDPDGNQIFIAITRLPAVQGSSRIGSLVLNPGGPGGSGLDLAYAEAELMPQEILDRFDLVGFDPRGVGQSTAARCPDDFDIGLESFDRCIDQSGDLLRFLGTPNVARDLDQIRAAVGDDQLTYLGYSYGTAVGAVYADLFPDRVRALVLDGAVDPAAGRANTSADHSGGDYYAEQDFDRTLEVYHALCDATAKCAAGPDSHVLLDRVENTVGDLPTSYFTGQTRVSRSDVQDIVLNSMYKASYWPALAVALKDADDGDASTLAAMYSWLQYGYPADAELDLNYDFAHLAILSADFADRGADNFDCDGFPDTADPLPEVVSIDAANQIVVIGTEDDPATPGHYAPLMATALGDAVAIQWEGAGHTAFLTSICITEIVQAYLVDLTVPTNGHSCPFVVGTTTLEERADIVFDDLQSEIVVASVIDVQVAVGDSEDIAACVASHLVARGDQRLIVHELLGVESPELVGVRQVIERSCEVGG